MYKISSFLCHVVTLVGASFVLNGCTVCGPTSDDLRTVVHVADPDGGTNPIEVSLPDRRFAVAAGKMRVKEWDLAISSIQSVLHAQEDPVKRPAAAYFALGLAYEMKNDYAAALSHHKLAFEKRNDVNYQFAVERVESHLGGAVPDGY